MRTQKVISPDYTSFECYWVLSYRFSLFNRNNSKATEQKLRTNRSFLIDTLNYINNLTVDCILI